jgi:hypothetical protein
MNCWYNILDDAIIDFDFTELVTINLHFATKATKVKLVHTGDWDGDEMEG